MKKCPFCAEEIQAEAIKCKHCGEWLTPDRQPMSEHTQTGRLAPAQITGASGNKICPKCKLINPPSAARCDCGFDFLTGVVEQSYLPPPPRPALPILRWLLLFVGIVLVEIIVRVISGKAIPNLITFFFVLGGACAIYAVAVLLGLLAGRKLRFEVAAYASVALLSLSGIGRLLL